ncbi:MAG TPA: biotin/lipoyl-containing protein [Candidatus Limnocylindrales bacterium]|nr:biotin/lipoyl-containing protein [Candidatus Limnocylindrales bacterium]HEU4918633.1 biotin/lipoyl-containing protein [Candidatus Limnocylindrales bacterium]
MTDEIRPAGEPEEVAAAGIPPTPDPAADLPPAPTDGGNASLLALIDRLGGLLERSDLVELEVEAGGTSLILRKPITVAPPTSSPAALPAATAEGPAGGRPAGSDAAPATVATAPSRPSIKAPLTGVWYGSPAPGSAPFVEVGREVAVGQVVGLIEAMKLFNEIKSDLAGRVVRVVPESGTLVKAKQPLIEVEPL